MLCKTLLESQDFPVTPVIPYQAVVAVRGARGASAPAILSLDSPSGPRSCDEYCCTFFTPHLFIFTKRGNI